MKLNKKSIGLIVGLICVILVVVLLLTMCNGGSGEPDPTEPTQPTEVAQATEVRETEEATEPSEATEPVEETTEPTEEATEPPTSSGSGSTRPGGTTGPSLNDTANSGDNNNSDSDAGSGEDEEEVKISDPGAQDNPYVEAAGAMPDSFTSVKIPADGRISYHVYDVGGNVLTITDKTATVVYNDTTYTPDADGVVTVELEKVEEGSPVVFQLGTTAGTETAYTLSFTERLGGATNPEILESIEQIETALEEGDEDGYFYQWTAAQDGVVTFAVESVDPANAGCDIILTVGETTVSLSGNGQTDENGKQTVSIEVAEGDELVIQVVTVDDTHPAAKILLSGVQEQAFGSEENPYSLFASEIPYTVVTDELASAEYHFYEVLGIGGTVLTIEDANAFVIYNGVTYGANAEGVVTVQIDNVMGRQPVAFQVGNGGETAESYTMTFAYPEGNTMNPAELVMGENTAVLEAGEFNGYWFSWTAPDKGELTIEMDPAANWNYQVNNETTGVSGDIHLSDDETVISTETVKVSKGDVIKIMVVTYDPADPWNVPAGNVTFHASFVGDPGTESNPIWVNNVQVPTTASVAAGETVYYTGYIHDMTMSIENAKNAAVTFNGKTYTADADGTLTVNLPAAAGMGRPMPVVFGITNNTGADASYTMTFAYPAGSQMNPAELVLGENTATVAAGASGGYWFSWTAEQAGTLTIAMDPEANWSYQVNNVTTSVSTDVHRSDDETVVSMEVMEVSAGDEISLMVTTVDPADPWNTPTGTVVFSASFQEAAGSETNPIGIYNIEAPFETTVAAGQTLYYTGSFYEVTLTIENASGAVVDFGGSSYSADSNGTVTVNFPKSTSMGWPVPVVISITNSTQTDAVYTLNFAYPAGHMMNPAQLKIGSNTAVLEAGDSDGYFFTWTAAEEGTVTIAMDPAAHWVYAVNNMTAGTYGDSHNSADDPQVASEELKVSAGDEIQVNVSTFNPADTWNAPAGTVTVNFSFTAASGEDVGGDTGDDSTDGDDTGSEGTEKEPVYQAAEMKVAVGSNTLTGMTDPSVTYAFEFEPTEVGSYSITTSDPAAKLSYCGGNAWFLGDYTTEKNYNAATNTLTIEAATGSIGASYFIGVTGATECTLTITRNVLDEVVINEVTYKAKQTPASFTLTLNEGESLTYLDLTTTYTLVKDSSGYYHLNSAEGQMVYVNLGENAPYVSMYNLVGASGVGGTGFYQTFKQSDGSINKEIYNDCMTAYAKCIDKTYGVYPLTEDLMYMLKNGGAQKGWWDSTSPNYLFSTIDGLKTETAWMFACCVVTAE